MACVLVAAGKMNQVGRAALQTVVRLPARSALPAAGRIAHRPASAWYWTVAGSTHMCPGLPCDRSR